MGTNVRAGGTHVASVAASADMKPRHATMPSEADLRAIPFDPDNLDSLTSDPATEVRVRELQRRAMAILNESTAALLAGLETVEPLPARNPSMPATTEARALTSFARQASQFSTDRRRSVHDVLVSAILNRNNPDWVMTDPSTYQVDPKDLLGLLIRLPLL
jgi:hypothetical protein